MRVLIRKTKMEGSDDLEQAGLGDCDATHEDLDPAQRLFIEQRFQSDKKLFEVASDNDSRTCQPDSLRW